jgi:hypothetical protein
MLVLRFKTATLPTQGRRQTPRPSNRNSNAARDFSPNLFLPHERFYNAAQA